MKKQAIKILKYLPVTIIICISWYLSGLERIELMPTFWNADKLVHMICFAGLSFWAAFATGIQIKKQIWIPVCITSVYGIIDEIHQAFTPGRSPSIFDWCADTIGAVVGAFIFLEIVKVVCRSRTKN